AEAAGGQQAALADLAISARRVAGLLEGGHVDHEAALAGLAELVAAVAGCCQALEVRLAPDPTGYSQRATRRLVQATGAAEALATRLVDVVAAMRHPTNGA
ncbi:MAG: hypothetical protein ACRDT2_07600, partial [Natronosporangium sp.]